MPKLTFDLSVYPFQIDFAGIVSNIVYIQWMEIGRTKLLAAAGMPIGELQTDDGLVPVLTHTSIDYKRPLRLVNTVRAEVWFSELRNASALIQHRFYDDDGRLCATGHQLGLFVDAATLRPHRFTGQERSFLEPFLVEDA